MSPKKVNLAAISLFFPMLTFSSIIKNALARKKSDYNVRCLLEDKKEKGDIGLSAFVLTGILVTVGFTIIIGLFIFFVVKNRDRSHRKD